MRIFFYFGHPAQFHFYKNIVSVFKEKGNEIFLFIKTKDVLESLVKGTGWQYENILPNERGKSKWAIFFSLLKRDIRIFLQILRHRPDILIASDPSCSQLGFLFRIPSLNFIDDDFDAVGIYSKITYPFTSTIITPDTVRVGRWEHKRVSYKGYMKLAYLHRNWFVPDETKIGNLKSKSYFLIRLSGLRAHHDAGITGIPKEALRTIINKLSRKGRVIISSEERTDTELEQYKMEIPVSDMHHFLYHAKVLVSDSQSMSGEAAMLGTPSVRISSFKGKLSVLEELEHKYGLTFAFNPENEAEIFQKVDELIEMPALTEVFQQRRQNMLVDKIDVTAFCIWFIENYPESKHIVQKNQGYAHRFR
jgi:uncharacterized protein